MAVPGSGNFNDETGGTAPMPEFDLPRLLAYMSHRGWTQSELSRRAGLSQSTVNRVLTARAQPGPKTIHGLLLACPGITYDDLFKKEERCPSNAT